jgi:hypothetical protein
LRHLGPGFNRQFHCGVICLFSSFLNHCTRRAGECPSASKSAQQKCGHSRIAPRFSLTLLFSGHAAGSSRVQPAAAISGIFFSISSKMMGALAAFPPLIAYLAASFGGES